MVRLTSRLRGGLAALKLTKLFPGIDDFPAAKDSGKVLIIIICYLIIIIIIIIIITTTISWIRAKVSFAILRSALLCLRGTRRKRRAANISNIDITSQSAQARI